VRIAAAELIGMGFDTWRTCNRFYPFHFLPLTPPLDIDDVDALIQRLFKLSLLNDSANISATAHHTLIQIGHLSHCWPLLILHIGTREPGRFVRSLGKSILEVHYVDPSGKPQTTTQHAAAIQTLGSLVNQVQQTFKTSFLCLLLVLLSASERKQLLMVIRSRWLCCRTYPL
jgi:hypothetical protein